MAVANQKGQILVVDDDQTTISLVSAIILEAGYSVLTATSGEEALNVFAANEIDLVITDIYMDGIDGFELMKRLLLLNSTLNVIVITGNDSYETVLKALQGGAYDYLQKPLDNHVALLASVDRAYTSAKLKQENTELVLRLEKSYEKISNTNNQLLQANHQLKKLAATDAVTLLFNRRYFELVLKREVNRRNRYNLPLSIVFLDIDHFKKINDTHGHEAGDNALKQISNILLECSRSGDIVSRYGGEEFAIILPQTEPENATVFTERVRLAIEAANFELLDGVNVKLTASIGICGVTYTHSAVSSQSMVSTADNAMYQAKDRGRNNYVLAQGIIDDQQKAA